MQIPITFISLSVGSNPTLNNTHVVVMCNVVILGGKRGVNFKKNVNILYNSID